MEEKYRGEFTSDSEKMYDFIFLSKEDFLKSYSYLTESEYEATANLILDICKYSNIEAQGD